MQAAIPELELPRLQIVRTAEPHQAGDEPSIDEVSGIIIGVEEDDQEDAGDPS